MEKEYDFLYKIILIGDSKSGKTSMIQKFCNNTFDEAELMTIGVDFHVKLLESN